MRIELLLAGLLLALLNLGCEPETGTYFEAAHPLEPIDFSLVMGPTFYLTDGAVDELFRVDFDSESRVTKIVRASNSEVVLQGEFIWDDEHFFCQTKQGDQRYEVSSIRIDSNRIYGLFDRSEQLAFAEQEAAADRIPRMIAYNKDGLRLLKADRYYYKELSDRYLPAARPRILSTPFTGMTTEEVNRGDDFDLQRIKGSPEHLIKDAKFQRTPVKIDVFLMRPGFYEISVISGNGDVIYSRKALGDRHEITGIQLYLGEFTLMAKDMRNNTYDPRTMSLAEPGKPPPR